MPAPAPAEQIDELLRSPDLFVPTSRIVDLLLDVRTSTADSIVHGTVDRDLRSIGSRHVLTAIEVQTMMDRLVPTLRMADQAAAAGWPVG